MKQDSKTLKLIIDLRAYEEKFALSEATNYHIRQLLDCLKNELPMYGDK